MWTMQADEGGGLPTAVCGGVFQRPFRQRLPANGQDQRKDSQTVQAWYDDAAAISQDYGVELYPDVSPFFSADGRPIHRADGAVEAKKFIQFGTDALDPTKQYYTLVAGAAEHPKDRAYLLDILKETFRVKDSVSAITGGERYCGCV